MIKNLNRSFNRRAIKAALTVYNTRISSVWDQQNQSLHPEHLNQDHNTAKYMALAAFHPDNKSGDFNPSDEDEVTLLDVIFYSIVISKIFISNTSDNYNLRGLQIVTILILRL